MYGNLNNPDNEITKNQNDYLLQHIDTIFKIYVDIIIPRTPELAEEFGRIQYYGALDLYTDEYMILTLNKFYIPLAIPTAEMLEIEWSSNESLSKNDLIELLNILQQNGADLPDLPLPFRNNPEYIISITDALNRFAMMGYYSEWSGYGSSRLNSPTERKLEYTPLSWEQVGYPGPSLGYRALRNQNSK